MTTGDGLSSGLTSSFFGIQSNSIMVVIIVVVTVVVSCAFAPTQPLRIKSGMKIMMEDFLLLLY